MARLAYLTQDQLPAHGRQLFDEIEARFGRLNDIFRVLAHHPELLRHVIDCGVTLRTKRGSIPSCGSSPF